MTIWQCLFLGFVEGLTEFLPISSTGHLVLASKMMGLSQTEFVKSFQIVIQAGAIFSVVCLYGKRFFVRREIWIKIFAAFLPTAVIGFLLYKIIKHTFLANEQVTLWALFIGGVLILVFERFHREKSDATDDVAAISLKTCIWIGLFQALAVIPGVSRAGATILGGLLLGLNRKTIVEFSFLLAVPTLLAATALDLYKSAPTFTSQESVLLVFGTLSSFVVAIAAIKFFIFYIQRNNFTIFGIYRIGLSFIFWFLR